VSLSESALSHITGISLAENGVSISWNNLPSLESGPKVVLDSLVAEIIANSSLHLGKPVQDFLVGETVERPSKTVKTSSQGEHGRAERTTNQVGSVGADIATFMVSVDGKVKSHQLNEVGVLAESKLVGIVETVILVLLDWGNLSSLENILVDSGSNGWELGDQVHRILKGVSPILGLLHSLGICLCESRLMLQSSDCDRELCHWVKVVRASVNELFDKLGEIGAGSPLCGQIADLLLTGDFTGEKKPEKTF
jgi:hypothetical protein